MTNLDWHIKHEELSENEVESHLKIYQFSHDLLNNIHSFCCQICNKNMTKKACGGNDLLWAVYSMFKTDIALNKKIKSGRIPLSNVGPILECIDLEAIRHHFHLNWRMRLFPLSNHIIARYVVYGLLYNFQTNGLDSALPTWILDPKTVCDIMFKMLINKKYLVQAIILNSSGARIKYLLSVLLSNCDLYLIRSRGENWYSPASFSNILSVFKRQNTERDLVRAAHKTVSAMVENGALDAGYDESLETLLHSCTLEHLRQ